MIEKIITPEKALDLCLPYVNGVGSSWVSVEEAWQRICAEDLYTPIDMPLFSHSIVDGLALHSSDISRMQKEKEIMLAVAGIIAAGDNSPSSLRAGQTVEIMTGAMLPEGTTAVVKKEEVVVEGGKAFFNGEVKAGDNIKEVGSYIKKGGQIAAVGEVLNPSLIELFASAGLAKIKVYDTPTVCVINTGSELVLPGEERQDGQIFASNKAFYYSLVKAAGCAPLGSRPVKDQIDEIIQQLLDGIEQSELVIISGGTAEGQYDLVQAAFRQIDAKIIFTGLDLKPGRHTTAAEKNGILLFNLPGNPGAGSIIFKILLKPLLRKLRGMMRFQNIWFDLSPDENILPVKKQRTMTTVEGEIKNGQLYAQVLSKAPRSSSENKLQLIVDLDPASSAIKAMLAD